MNVLLIPDKFKGSLSAEEVIVFLTKGIKKANPNAQIHSFVASDGGDGFLDAVSKYTEIEEVSMRTLDPLGRAIKATYLFQQNNATAYIELAKASGMELLEPQERNPLLTSTYGTGLQLMHALKKGARNIYLGLGGSATNDAGIGLAKALGFLFFDIRGNELAPIGRNLAAIDRIQAPEISNMLKDVHINAVNDVQNPLYGEKGAAYVYAAQKGADTSDIVQLDAGLEHLDKVVSHQFKVSNAQLAGAGAAGGTAYGLKTFAGANFIGGIDFVLKLAGVEALLENNTIDYVITGEGSLDEQTLDGKLINGVMNLGRKHHIPVIAVCGALAVEKEVLYEQGLEAVIEVRDKSKSLEYNMNNASGLVEIAIFNYFS